MKLALGTVQFGLDYGAFNAGGRPALADVEEVLAIAEAAGMDTLDTARAYGESEAVLGSLDAARRFRIVTKIASLHGGGAVAVRRSFEASLAALQAERVAGLMLHDADDLLRDDADDVWGTLGSFVEAGRVERIGVSCYTPSQALAVVSRYPIGLVQIPANVFDLRFADCGLLDRFAASGVEVHVRSALLQGFAVADPQELPPALASHRPLLDAFEGRAAHHSLTRLQAALGVMLADARIDHVVVGVDGAAQLQSMIDTVKPVDPALFLGLNTADENLLNPSRWTANGLRR